MFMIKDECQTCNGEGQLFEMTGPIDRADTIPGDWVECKACRGAGGWERDPTLKERIERLEEMVDRLDRAYV
jgi:DnaJ-class molecular chaperone